MKTFILRLIAIAFVLASNAVCAQTPSRPDLAHISTDGTPIRIATTADIPPRLRAVIDGGRDCALDETIMRELPIVVFKAAPNARTIALVTCKGIVATSRAYTTGPRPELVEFAVAAPDGGFMSSPLPGLMQWYPETKTIVATEGTDICGAQILRHTYRYGPSGFAVIKVEQGDRPCGNEATWTEVWRAPVWNIRR